MSKTVSESAEMSARNHAVSEIDGWRSHAGLRGFKPDIWNVIDSYIWNSVQHINQKLYTKEIKNENQAAEQIDEQNNRMMDGQTHVKMCCTYDHILLRRYVCIKLFVISQMHTCSNYRSNCVYRGIKRQQQWTVSEQSKFDGYFNWLICNQGWNNTVIALNQ